MNKADQRSSDKEEIKDSSVQFMLAEYSRITEGESFNRNSGERRVNLYLSIFSLVVASLVGLWQFIDTTRISALREYFVIVCISTAIMALFGVVTFRLLIQRWYLSIVYLRKLARIRQWFVQHDAKLVDGLVYAADEQRPSFVSKRFLSSSLFTLITLLNGVSVGTFVMCLLLLLFPSFVRQVQGNSLALFTGVVTGLITWSLQRKIALNKMATFEARENVAFPDIRISKDF